MNFLERMLYLVYHYRLITIIAFILSIYTYVKLVMGMINADYVTIIIIPIILVVISGYLGVAIFSKEKAKSLIYATINIVICVVTLSYNVAVNKLSDIPILFG